MTKYQDLFKKYEKTIKDDYSIVVNSLKGIDAKVFYDLALITGLKKEKLADEIFEISIKTIKRYSKDEKKLNARNSELILKIISLYKKGVEIFGDTIQFNNWINKKAYGLGNQIPFKLMNTSTGIDLIYEELIRIEFGSLA